jgi:hypothetical protein
LKTKQDIKNACYQLGITSIVINDDLTVDVNGNVDLKDTDLIELPVKFNRINGYFDVRYNQNLVNTDNFPVYVKDNLFASYCGIKELTDMPLEIGGSLDISFNELSEITFSKERATLGKCKIGLNLYAQNNYFYDLSENPFEVGQSIDLSYCKLYDMYGIQQTVNGLLNLNGNQIDTYANMPEKIELLSVFGQIEGEPTVSKKLVFYADMFNEEHFKSGDMNALMYDYKKALTSPEYNEEQMKQIKDSLQSCEEYKILAKKEIVAIKKDKLEESFIFTVYHKKPSLLADIDMDLMSQDERKGYSDIGILLAENNIPSPLPLEFKPKKIDKPISAVSFKKSFL